MPIGLGQRMTTNSVFLSYARSNLDYARMMHDRIEAEQILVWWDQEEQPGADWLDQVDTWLYDAHAVVVVVSQHSAISISVKNEVLLAQDYQRRVIPIVLEKTRGGLWVLIRSLQWIDAREGRDPVPDLLQALDTSPSGESARPEDPSDKPPGPHDPFDKPPGPEDDMLNLDNEMQQLMPPSASVAQAQVTITLPGDINDFCDREQFSLIQIIARFAKLRPDQIKIVFAVAGSIHVTLELPESSARWLVAMFERRAPLIELLDIQAVYALQVLPATLQMAATLITAHPGAQGERIAAEQTPPNFVERLTAWFRGWMGWPSLSIAGGLAAVLLVAVLINTLRGPALPPDTLVGVVDNVQGTLELQGADWNAFVPVADGAKLRAGDRLRLEADAQASVVCADGTRVELQPGTAPAPCQSVANRLLFDIDQAPLANAVLSPDAADIPQIISPRATALLTTTPAIRWTAVDGTEAYTVTLQREGEDIWSVTTNDTMLTYPADQPPLEPGPIYRFVVVADDGSREYAQGSGVQLLDAEQAQTIDTAARQIEELIVDDVTKRVLLVNLYAKNGLYADALALLETQAGPGDQAATLRLQGDIYVAIGLPNLAVAPYTQAIMVAKQSGDRLGQAQANWMLGTVYRRLGGAENRERAVTHYQQALQFYQEVGDVDAQAEIQQLLDDLASPQP